MRGYSFTIIIAVSGNSCPVKLQSLWGMKITTAQLLFIIVSLRDLHPILNMSDVWVEVVDGPRKCHCINYSGVMARVFLPLLSRNASGNKGWIAFRSEEDMEYYCDHSFMKNEF